MKRKCSICISYKASIKICNTSSYSNTVKKESICISYRAPIKKYNTSSYSNTVIRKDSIYISNANKRFKNLCKNFLMICQKIIRLLHWSVKSYYYLGEDKIDIISSY